MSGAAGGDAATEVRWLALAATPGRGAGRASGALLVERLHQQRGKGRCDKHVEMPDTREVAEDRRHGGRELLQQRADARVNFLASAAALNVAADHLVQRIVARAVVGGDAEALGEFCASARLSGSSPPAPAGTVRFPNRPFFRNRRWATAALLTKATILTFAPTPPQISRKIVIRLERRRHACRTHDAP